MTPTPRRIHKRELLEVVADMPEIETFDPARANEADLLILVLGFEDRTLATLDALVESGCMVASVAVIEYATNQGDNILNLAPMKERLKEICNAEPTMLQAGQGLAHSLRGLLSLEGTGKRVVFDLSVASNDVTIEAVGALLDCDICLTLLYAEAAEYRPAREEFESERGRFLASGEMGLDDGVLDVAVAGENNGAPSPNLPDSLIIFPGFSRDRVRAIISQVNSDWIVAPEFASLTWMVGLPPHRDLLWRREALYEIHEIKNEQGVEAHDVSTFDYRETLRSLDEAYASQDYESNLTIAALGSKMQALGIALFGRACPDVSVYLARPRVYNAGSYTRGVRSLWQIPLGTCLELSDALRSVGTLELLEIESDE